MFCAHLQPVNLKYATENSLNDKNKFNFEPMRFLQLLLAVLAHGVNSSIPEASGLADKDAAPVPIKVRAAGPATNNCYFCKRLHCKPRYAYAEDMIMLKVHNDCADISKQGKKCHIRCLFDYFEYCSFECPFCSNSLWQFAVDLCKELTLYNSVPKIMDRCTLVELSGVAHGQKLLAAMHAWMPQKAPTIIAQAAEEVSRAVGYIDDRVVRHIRNKSRQEENTGKALHVTFKIAANSKHKHDVFADPEQYTLEIANKQNYDSFFAQLTLLFIPTIMKCSGSGWLTGSARSSKTQNTDILKEFEAFQNNNLLKVHGRADDLLKITPFYRVQKKFIAYAAASTGHADKIFPVLQASFGFAPLELLEGAMQAIVVFGERKHCPQPLCTVVHTLVKCIVSDTRAHIKLKDKAPSILYNITEAAVASQLYKLATWLMQCSDTVQAGFSLLLCMYELSSHRQEHSGARNWSVQYITCTAPYFLRHGNENIKAFLKCLLARINFESHIDALAMEDECCGGSAVQSGARQRAFPQMVRRMHFSRYTCSALLSITLNIIASRTYSAPELISILPPAFFFSPEFCFAVWAGQIPLALVAEHAPREVHRTQFVSQQSAFYHGYYHLLANTKIDFERDVQDMLESLGVNGLAGAAGNASSATQAGLGAGQISCASTAGAKCMGAPVSQCGYEPDGTARVMRLESGALCTRGGAAQEPAMHAVNAARPAGMKAEAREYNSMEHYLSRVPIRVLESFKDKLLGTLVDVLAPRPYLQARVLWGLCDAKLLKTIIAQKAADEEHFKRVLIEVFIDEAEKREISVERKKRKARLLTAKKESADEADDIIDCLPVTPALLYTSPLFPLVAAELIAYYGPDSVFALLGGEFIGGGSRGETARETRNSEENVLSSSVVDV